MTLNEWFCKYKKVDAHSHVGKFGSPFNIDFDEARLLEQMDGYHIERTILCDSSCHSSAEVAEIYKQHPDRIIPLVWVNAAEGQTAYDMAEHFVRDEGFAGFKMQPLFDAFTADSPCVDPVMELARAYDKPVFIHCGHPPFSLPWQIGLLAKRHPDVKIVMIHMGHGHGVYIEGAVNTALQYDNLYLECSGMPMGCWIKKAYETVGSEKVMFGIDSPFHDPSVEIQRVMTSGLGEKELEDVFYNNAMKLMGLL
ncbi:MAG: amidohydrolase [Lachnospiraceae bacterium]|nr:amidohydrolase [Lachnospiraceae bacterium]